MNNAISMTGAPANMGYGSFLENTRDVKSRYAGKISNTELKNRFVKDIVQPYYRLIQPDVGVGAMLGFNEYLACRPDGGQVFLSQKTGQPLTISDLLEVAGIDPVRDSLNSLAALSDDFKFLFGPLVGDIFIKGFAKNAAGQPALWQQLCFQVGIPTQFPAFRKAWFTFSGQPVSTSEAEPFPQASIGQGTEEIRLQKFGLSIRMTEEFIKSSPLNVIEAWLEEMGRIYQALEDGRAVTTLVSGDLSTGANAAPIIGVSSTAVGLDYADLSRCWTRGAIIGERWFAVVSGEEMSNKLAAIDEFKIRQTGTSQVTLANRPEPYQIDRYISPSIPDHQIMLVDTSHALRQRNFIPIRVDKSFKPESWERGLVVGYQSGYERVADKGVIIIDETLDFASHGFPTWYSVGGTRP
jgi:hypothetical protein